MSIFLFVSLVVLSVTFGVIYRRQKAENERLHEELIHVQQEEHRVFDFLHGLGEAFSADLQQRDLYRLIVDGASKILDAHGGALYLTDRSNSRLVPAYISKTCPPLVEVPPHIVDQATTTPIALESYLRLHSIKRGEGLLGGVWEQNEAVLIDASNDPRLTKPRGTSFQTASALVGPLNYGKQTLGIFAVANGPMAEAFTQADLEVFKPIVEQSAFALYNALIYSEASEKKRLDHDLQTAREIQSILLPAHPPQIPGFEISGLTLPARLVSGDYFDYIKVSSNQTGVVIADVSGKGVPASLIMAMCRSVLRNEAIGESSPTEVLRQVNRQIYPDIKEDMFISLAYLVLNHETKSVTLSAGHDAPLLYSAKDQSIIRLNPRGMAIGIDSGDVFDRVITDFSVNLEKGDCLILYTDGVTEAMDDKGMEYGLSRMKQSVLAGAPLGAEGILTHLTEDLRNFVGDRPQNDDVTLIIIRKL